MHTASHKRVARRGRGLIAGVLFVILAAGAASADVQIVITPGGPGASDTAPDPAMCIGPFTFLPVSVSVGNSTNSSEDVVLTLTLTSGWVAEPGTCTGDGVCSIPKKGPTVEWSGTVPAMGTLAFDFEGQVAPAIHPGTDLCADISGTTDGTPITPVHACLYTTTSAQDCNVAAPAINHWRLAVLAALLAASGWLLVRRRA